MLSIFNLPHGEARRLLAQGAPVYLSVDPIEYHGPHLSLHNDALISAGLIRDLHARLAEVHPEWRLLSAGSIEAGVEPVPGPGSQPIGFAALRRLVLQACQSLVELGACRVVLMSFHGSPLHNIALHAGVEFLERCKVLALAPNNLLMREFLTLGPEHFAEAFAQVEDAREREALARAARFDLHAGFGETSVSLHYAPASVSPDFHDLPPCPEWPRVAWLEEAARVAARLGREVLAQELSYAANALGWFGLRPFPGYTSRPHLANARAGKIIADTIVSHYAACAEAVFSGRARSPEPIMRWLPTASLGGRVGAVRIPPSISASP